MILRLAAAIAAVLGLAGCGLTEDQDDVPAVSMSRAEVVAILNANMRALDPEWRDSDPAKLSPGRLARHGCWTNPNTMMPDGPPWSYRIGPLTYGGSPEKITRILRGVDTLGQRGFSPIDPIGMPSRGRGDRYVRDARKFTVGVSFEGSDRVSVSASSPCVRHPNPADDER
ncbi:hypothetical protein ACLQ3C_10115 [Gordonia sp. DT30]|uniref:hypothetical protein n=1 Tax=unclassified Gordonia (in: high G+C Gram-positive bacteria) TaxID=2657482 RepID=UPI003CF0BEBA